MLSILVVCLLLYRYVALVMSPVADCNLREFIERTDSSLDDISFLRTIFGCLASTLNFLHQQGYTYGDIRPEVSVGSTALY